MFEEVKDFLLQFAEVDDEDIAEETNLSDLGIDSMKMFELIAKFEERFGVKVSDKQLSNLFTVHDLINIVEKK